MLSRTADSLYWMSRYLERAEHTARMAAVNLNFILEDSAGSYEDRLTRLLRVLYCPMPEEDQNNLTSILNKVVFDRSHPNSIFSCVASARENARQVREQISTELWEYLNRFYLEIREMAASGSVSVLEPALYKRISELSFLLQGITDMTLSHEEGWQFIRLGRYLERLESKTEMLKVYLQAYRLDRTADPAQQYLEKVEILKYSSAFEPYCKVYTADLRFAWIAEFLILNPDFPHSLRYAMRQVDYSLGDIEKESGGRRSGQLSRIAGKSNADLEFSTFETLQARGIDQFLADLESASAEIHKEMHQVYIRYSIDAEVGNRL